jgi:ATP-binding cassette subfamily F protein uup
MSLVRLENISLRYGQRPLLREVNLAVEEHERICLIGRNGAGKSTLMKIIAGEVTPDDGDIHYRDHLNISKLEQTLPVDLHRSVNEVVSEGLASQQHRIHEYQQLSAGEPDANTIKTMEALQTAIEHGGGWNLEKQTETIISQLGLPKGKTLQQLSGGWQRRVMLGKALVSSPDLLLLDEPTNHLDIATIEWLEQRVRGYQGTVVFITHDRNFLQNLATRIVDIDRSRVTSWPGSFDNYLKLKAQANEEEDTANALFDKKLAQEETWIRQGIKARRTRNEGRVRSLHAMREEADARIKRQGKVKIHINESEISGKKVIEARNICHAYQNETLIRNFKIRIMRGERIGIIGNNGVGKSTLLKILLGDIQPDQGSLKIGTNLNIGYFDQIRRELDPDRTVIQTIGDGKDYIQVNGKERHVVGYMKNFLFSPDRSRTKISSLSGGEKNRVLLAKLFTRSTNMLVLDEPTNDLDVEMLEVLEEQLVNYSGTLLVVSHDRQFLDNVVDKILVFEEDAGLQEYVGGYTDWLRRGHSLKISQDEKPPEINAAVENSEESNKPKSVKLSYKLQRELDMLPEEIATLEESIETLEEEASRPGFYDQDFSDTKPLLDELEQLQHQLDEKTSRWVELEEMKNPG